MMAALSRIKALKDRREETARNEVRSCALALEQAARAVETCRAEAYSRHVVEQRDRFYDELETKVVVLDEVDEVRDRIAALRRKEADLYLKVEEAEERRRAAALRLEAARRPTRSRSRRSKSSRTWSRRRPPSWPSRSSSPRTGNWKTSPPGPRRRRPGPRRRRPGPRRRPLAQSPRLRDRGGGLTAPSGRRGPVNRPRYK